MKRKDIVEYYKELAEEYEVSYETVATLGDLLGESELYDGLVTSLEDMIGY